VNRARSQPALIKGHSSTRWRIGMLARTKDDEMIGRIFVRLKVLARGANDKNGLQQWLCECQCGKHKLVRRANLVSGHTRSCGCLVADRNRDGRNITHGHSKNGRRTPEYRAWEAILRKCYNPNDANYANHGGRGITTCEEWRDFQMFLQDVGPRPSRKHYLGRRKYDGGYTKDNCQWITGNRATNGRRRVGE
jgi:hypothetical protein